MKRIRHGEAREPPTRDCRGLFAFQKTVDCVLKNKCVPCGYKIACFDVALDTTFSRSVPNQRPEQCPRAKIQSNMISLLDKGMRVLTVGDGDLSFSRSLARLLGPRLTATSYEPRETVLKVYPGVEEIINAIETLGCQILFGVDATKLHEQFKGAKFDTIVWNFPCQAVAKGQDGQNQEMEANKKLIAQFARSCLAVLGDRGTVHITHKTKPPYNQWSIVDVVEESTSSKLSCQAKVVFDRCLYSPYVPRKALHRKSFPTHDACIYLFGFNRCSMESDQHDLVTVDAKLLSDIRKVLLESKRTQRKRRHSDR